MTIETGGSLLAACELIASLGVQLVAAIIVVELGLLDACAGRQM
ncbi:MAG: hypothetical protein ABI304_06530 [Rudaea sp.]